MIPKYLYKYSNYFNDNGQADKNYTKINIIQDQIYFSKKNKLNDPYELRFIVIEPENNSIMESAVGLKSGRQIDFWYEEHFENMGIFSLSAKNNSMLLYSHYGNKHEGICLEYDTSKDEIFLQAFPVNYRNSIPSIYYPEYFKYIYNENKEFSTINQLYSTKSQDWVYEEEWRIIHPVNSIQDGYKYQIKSEALTGIIFGLNTKDEDKNEIIKIINNKKHTIKLYQAKLHKERYSLNIEPIK